MKKIGILVMAVLLLTGCVQQLELTAQESDTIANYAAYVTLQHDKDYDKRLIETATETVTENITESGEQVTPQQTENNANILPEDPNIQDASTQETALEEPASLDIATVLKLDGFNVSYEGFEYAKQYQDTTQPNGYTANSLENSQFVVMKFNIENTTDEVKLCDVLSISPRLKVSVNGEEAINSYASLLNNDITTLCNEIEAHESMEAVLLVEVGQEYENNVSSLSLDLVINGVISTIVLQ